MAPKRILFIRKVGDPVETAASILGVDPEKYGTCVASSPRSCGERAVEARKSREKNDPESLLRTVLLPAFGDVPLARVHARLRAARAPLPHVDWLSAHAAVPGPPSYPERLRIHDLRHTCAALLISQGAHPKAIQAPTAAPKS